MKITLDPSESSGNQNGARTEYFEGNNSLYTVPKGIVQPTDSIKLEAPQLLDV